MSWHSPMNEHRLRATRRRWFAYALFVVAVVVTMC